MASLPMYDFPEAAASTDAAWGAMAEALRARGIAAPQRLTRPDGALIAHWTRPDLLLTQTCAWPAVTALADRVRLLASPVYAAEGCTGPTYRSAILVRRADAAGRLADLRGRVVAINGRDSLSGCHALRFLLAPLVRDGRFFEAVVETGAHRASARAVAEGAADLCAVDCVTWRLIGLVEPDLAGRLRVLGWTEPAPSLPFVAPASTPDALAAVMTAAVIEACAAPSVAAARGVLGLAGAVAADPAHYAAVAAQGARADAAGYTDLF